MINFPDEAVDQAGFVYDGVELLAGQDCYIGLPNMIDALPIEGTAADFTVDLSGCKEVTVEIDPCWSYFEASWDFGDDSPPAGGDQAVHSYAEAGTYTIELTLSGSLGVQATVSKTVQITENTPPIYGPQAVCADTPLPPDYSTDPVEGAIYQWTVIDGNGEVTGNPNGLNAGIDWNGESGILQLEVITGSGCVLSNTLEVDVFVSPVVDLPLEFAVYGNDPVELNGIVNGGAPPYELEWQPNTGLSFPASPDLLPALAAPAINTVYMLNATDANGCQNADAITVLVEGSNAMGAAEEETLLQVFPNPSSGQVFFEWDGHLPEGATIRILDSSGKVVQEGVFRAGRRGELQIPHSGLFIYECRVENRPVARGKLIVIR